MIQTSSSLERILEEINDLKLYMYEISHQVDNLAHPLLVEVSQLLDQKLNQHQQMISQR